MQTLMKLNNNQLALPGVLRTPGIFFVIFFEKADQVYLLLRLYAENKVMH